MSKMSHDRVHFVIKAAYLQKVPIQMCIEETLGITKEQFTRARSYDTYTYEDLNIVCRPSQFARFIILRHIKYGEPNNMSALNMKLVVPEPKTKVIDASFNRNTVNETVSELAKAC